MRPRYAPFASPAMSIPLRSVTPSRDKTAPRLDYPSTNSVALTVIGSAEVIEAPTVLLNLHQLLPAAQSVRLRLARKQRRPGCPRNRAQSIGKLNDLFHRPPRHPELGPARTPGTRLVRTGPGHPAT